MSEEKKPTRENDPHTLEFIMAAGPSHVTIWPGLREADERSKGAESRREDWIRMRPDMFGLRVRVPRQFTTGTKVYPATAEQLAEAAERAGIVQKRPTEVVVGKPLDEGKPGKGNGTEATVEASEPAEPEPREIKTSPPGA